MQIHILLQTCTVYKMVKLVVWYTLHIPSRSKLPTILARLSLGKIRHRGREVSCRTQQCLSTAEKDVRYHAVAAEEVVFSLSSCALFLLLCPSFFLYSLRCAGHSGSPDGKFTRRMSVLTVLGSFRYYYCYYNNNNFLVGHYNTILL